MTILVGLTIVAAGVALAIGLLLLPFRPLRRAAKRSLAGFGVLAVLSIAGIVAVHDPDDAAARAVGFANGADYREAMALGVTTGAAWDEYRRAKSEKAKQERAAQEKMAEQERAAKAEAKERECLADLDCAGERVFVHASAWCQPLIEEQAKYTHEWTDGFLEPKFSHHRWRDKKSGIITMIGDKARFQTGFGAWQNVVYECDVDVKTKKPISARVKVGRLPAN